MTRRLLRLFPALLVFATWTAAHAAEKVYELKPTAATVHRGYFDARQKPALTIDSGDVVRIWTASGNPKYYEDLGVPREKIPPELYTAYEGEKSDQRLDQTLTGPIFVRGAETGDTIEVRIRKIDLWLPLAAMSFRAGRGSLPEEFPYSRDRVMWLDVKNRTLDFAPGVVVPLTRPFWGDIGVAPPASMGRINASVPGVHGGNMDNKDLVAGTSLFLPVHVPGALLSIGDGHAAQGHGEVGLSAIETSLQGEIQVVLHKGRRQGWPRAETPTHYMTIGLHEDLHQAMKMAVKNMLDFIVETKGLSRDDAYMLMSAQMDLHVTQVVDGTRGVHAMMPKAVFRK